MDEHPDTPERIEAIEERLSAADWAGAELREARLATESEIQLVHTPALIERIRTLCERGGGAIDEDTFVGTDSFDAAMHAAGGACAMVTALLASDDDVAFCGTRSSGHHADADRAMGFCLFNNVAIAAELAIRELGASRVMIIDWDVHHGNGTAEIFRSRADVLYTSIHQSGLYPGTGSASDTGSGLGRGYTINLPVPSGSDEEVWISLLEHLVIPIGEVFEPDLVLISAGFDAHRDDPLANCTLESTSFGQMAAHARDFGRELGAPVGAVLEGGYEPGALAESVLATVQALGGDEQAESIAPDPIFTPRFASRLAHFWGI